MEVKYGEDGRMNTSQLRLTCMLRYIVKRKHRNAKSLRILKNNGDDTQNARQYSLFQAIPKATNESQSA
jgi:hypothetical protein